MSLGCAAIDDVTAWCILAAVLAIVKSDGFGGSILTIFLILIYADVMILLLKPFLRRLAPVDHASRHQYNSWAALILYPTQADISVSSRRLRTNTIAMTMRIPATGRRKRFT